jgi:hypothetical protein
MDDRTAINLARDILRENLEDPMIQWGKTDRTWIHTDEPLQAAMYPRVQIEKIGNTNINIISCGFEYWEQRFVPVNIWFWTKHDFKWTYSDETLKNEDLVAHYLEKIQNVIKENAEQLKFDEGIYLKISDIGDTVLDESGQFYVGRVVLSIMYFKK